MALENYGRKLTPASALAKIWKQRGPKPSLPIVVANLTLSSISLITAAVSAKVYYDIGDNFFTKFLAERVPSANEAALSGLGGIVGVGGVGANALFNFWAVLRYMERLWMFEAPEENIINKKIRNKKYWAKLALLHAEAVFANFAMTYISWKQEDAIDAWVVLTFIFGTMIYYVSLDLCVESCEWLYSQIREALNGKTSQESLNAALLKFYKEEYRNLRENFHWSSEKDALLKKMAANPTLWQKLKPYVLGGLPVTLLLFGSRLGLIYKGYNAASALVGGSHFLTVIVTGLAIAPPIALGIKSFNTIGAWLYHKLTGPYYSDDSVAMQTYPTITKIGLLAAGVFVALSFASNSELCIEAAEALALSVVFFAIDGALGSLITNGFGVFNLIYDMIERALRAAKEGVWGVDYAKEEYFLRAFQTLLSNVLQDPKSAIEYLIYHPEIAHEEGFPLEALQEAATQVKFTPKEMRDIQINAGYDDALDFGNTLYALKLHGIFSDDREEDSEKNAAPLSTDYLVQIPSSLSSKNGQRM